VGNSKLERLGKAERHDDSNPVQRRIRVSTRNGNVADWTSVDADAVIAAISAAALVGGALRFGYTRDGGAYAIGVYGDGDPYTLYCSPGEDLVGMLADIRSGFDLRT
jgi:hypothetical protein